MNQDIVYAIITGNKHFPEHIGKVVEVHHHGTLRDMAGKKTVYYSTVPELLSDDGVPILYREEHVTILDHNLEVDTDVSNQFFTMMNPDISSEEYYRALNKFCENLHDKNEHKKWKKSRPDD